MYNFTYICTCTVHVIYVKGNLELVTKTCSFNLVVTSTLTNSFFRLMDCYLPDISTYLLLFKFTRLTSILLTWSICYSTPQAAPFFIHVCCNLDIIRFDTPDWQSIMDVISNKGKKRLLKNLSQLMSKFSEIVLFFHELVFILTWYTHSDFKKIYISMYRFSILKLKKKV